MILLQGGPVVQQSGIQCFNCKEFGHYAKECRKPKRVKDSTYHKEKILLCKQAEKGVQLQAEQSDWLADTDEEIDEQELEAHYSYMAKIQEVPNADSGTDAEPLEQVQYDTDDNVFLETGDSNVTSDSPDMCDNDIQDDLKSDLECDDEHELMNLKLIRAEFPTVDSAFDKNGVLEECKEIYTELLQSFAKLEKHSISLEIALQECQEQLKNDTVCKEKASNVFRKEREQYFEIQDLKAQLQDKNIAISELKKLIEKCKGKSVDTKFDKPSVVRQPNAQRIPKPSVLGKPAPFSNSLERTNFAKKKSVSKTNESEGLSKPVTPQNLPQKATQAVRNTNVIKPGMYQIASSTTQTRAPQLNQTSRNTNPRVSTSTGVAHKTNVCRPQPRSNQTKDKVVPNTSHVKFKKTEVEEHPRISSISNQTKSVTACNDSLNSRTSNVNVVCATCGKCVFNSNHDACVSKYLNDVNARTKKPKVVPISTRKSKSQANKSVATYRKKTVASESTITNSKSYYRMLYEKTNKAWKWWIEQQCPSGYKWVPKTKKKWVPKVRNENLQKRVSFAIDNASRITNIVQLILFIVYSRCTKHMTGILSLLWYSTRRPQSNLFSVGQFCDADLEVAFRKSTCFVRDLQGNDLLTGNRGTDLYTISLQETTSSTPICLMAKASPTQAWLWHRRLSHLNFDYINLLSKKDVVIGLPKLKYVKDQLCSSCEVSKAKRSSFKSKTVPSLKGRLNLLHMDLCGPMRVASINGKKYILVIIDDYSRYTWTLFLRSKDETPEVLKDFLTMIQRNLQALVISVRTDRGTEFLNKTLNAFFKEEGIEHQTSTPRTPKQNGIVERRNRTLVEAARMMLSASKLPLFFWARHLQPHVILKTDQSSSQLMRKRHITSLMTENPQLIHLNVWVAFVTNREVENLDKMKEKGDPCILVGYSTQSKGYRVYNKRTRYNCSITTSSWIILFRPLYDEFFNDGTSRVNKSSSPTDNSTPQDTHPSTNIHPTIIPSTPTNVNAEENNNDQAEFTNPFCTPVQEIAESSSRNIDPEMCMFALTVSIVEPKNIKEAMADYAWIEAMQEELHQHSYQAHPYSVSLHKGNKVENGKMPTKTDANAGTIFQQGVSNDVLKRVNTYAVRITMLIADIEEESLDPDNIKMEMVMHHSAGKSNSLPHAHAQTTKTYYKHPRLRFMKSS
ncbi:retrovirus-related pol polyprotein from transposon TNT 1-94 [Tanacetum coccineum]|uniref:Retrovirus-related pol polyprotein from transposon TNT 1-94 n=1 Tax=Tanacetum coccineum TaxID=301880 RepID=A0ABQ5EJ65_9ASTR